MRYLLHCIFEGRGDEVLPAPCSGGEHRLHVFEKHDLCAAVSEVAGVDRLYNMREILDYHRTIEWIFGRVTVVPFRFGTLLEERADVERLLENRHEHYRAILRKLDGCAEIGIRAIVEDDEHNQMDSGCTEARASVEGPTQGILYLQRRKDRYGAESLLAEQNRNASAKYVAAFEGMFKEFKSEISKLPNQDRENVSLLLSLNFLVPKDRLERFRLQFAALAAGGSSKLLLSGPWPPYNFVVPTNTPTA